MYVNTTPIDEYIDRYFMFYCPESQGVSANNAKVYDLFKQIFYKGISETLENEDKELIHKKYWF